MLQFFFGYDIFEKILNSVKHDELNQVDRFLTSIYRYINGLIYLSWTNYK